jgi:NADH-quinone oxidoreductase subunit K
VSVPVSYYIILSVLLFVLGIIAFFVKKDLITQFMSVEVMLNAANLAFLALARAANFVDAQAIVFFVITVAAAEAAIGMAIILVIFRRKKSIKTEDLRSMKG